MKKIKYCIYKNDINKRTNKIKWKPISLMIRITPVHKCLNSKETPRTYRILKIYFRILCIPAQS